MGGAVEGGEAGGEVPVTVKLTETQREYARKLELFLQEQKSSRRTPELVNAAIIRAAIMRLCPTWEEFVSVQGLDTNRHFATFMMGVECGVQIGLPEGSQKH